MENVFLNRELSWIEFNARVLNQALDKNLPLMERIKFLSIVSSNFDEFFQVRVASVKRLVLSAPDKRDSSGLTPESLMRQISNSAHKIIHEQQHCLMRDIIPALAENGFIYTPPTKFTEKQKEFAHNFFKDAIYPLLTPLRTDAMQFPHIRNLNIHAAFLLKPSSGVHSEISKLNGSDEVLRIALVPIPDGLPNIVWLPTDGDENHFALLNDIIEQYSSTLFSGFTVAEKLFFKIARDADFSIDERENIDFINAMENVLVQRSQSSFVVQMTCTGSSPTIREFLRTKLGLAEYDVYTIPNILSPDVFNELHSHDENTQLSYPVWHHFYSTNLPQDKTYWDTLKERDVFLHVPYESYEPVIKFITDASTDPKVLAIKMTLYRTGNNSPIVDALRKAAQNGKQVTVLVELKARFDEGRNILWAEQLEHAGVTVIYGLVNLKVHAKILIVIRKEHGALKKYVHLSTGNYNHKTAALYSDLSIFSANEDIANDAAIFFNLVTGYSTLQPMKYLAVAPVTLKEKILSMIEREIQNVNSGHGGMIMAKMNSLTHEEIISALYKASCAGVKIILNVRGICTLVPGVEGMSENISVVSIVDRYLEHSRILYFQNGDAPELYLSSADWMPRNLERRVELMFPVLDKNIFAEIKNTLDIYFMDNTNSYRLDSSGNWEPNKPSGVENRAQEILYNRYKQNVTTVARKPKHEFKVRRKKDFRK